MSDFVFDDRWHIAFVAAVTLFVQSSILLLPGLALAAWIARRGAAMKSAALRATLAGVVLAPIATLAVQALGMHTARFTLPVQLPQRHHDASQTASNLAKPVDNPPAVATIASNPAPTRAVRLISPANPPAPAEPHTPASLPPASPDTPPAVMPRIDAVLTCLWMAGAGLLLARLLTANLLIAMIRRRANPATPELTTATAHWARQLQARSPAIGISSHIKSPCLVGWLRPMILLPPEDTLQADPDILLHELAHVSRRDCPWQLLGRLTVAILWFQPFLWLLVAEMERAAEEACDDLVLLRGADRGRYARRLIDLAERSQTRRAVWTTGVGVVAPRSGIGRRVARMLDLAHVPSASASSASRWLLGASVAVVVLTISMIRASATQAVPPASSPAKSAIEGRVISFDGTPVAGAQLYLLKHATYEQPVLKTTSSDAQGHFAFDDVPPGDSQSLGPEVLVHVPGTAIRAYRVNPGASNQLRLEPPTRVTVTLLDTDGKPIEGLRVEPAAVFPPMTSPGERTWSTRFPADVSRSFARMTDARGVVTFEDLARHANLLIKIADERYANPTGRIALAEDATTPPTTIRLQPASAISGKVTYGPTGAPAPGIRIGVQGLDRASSGSAGLTDPSGNFRVTQVRPGEYNVVINLSPEIQKDWTAAARQNVTVTPGRDVTGINFTLIHGSVIRGKVTRADTGKPLFEHEASVLAQGPAHPQTSGGMQGTTIASDGTYMLRVPAGKQDLYLSGETPDAYNSQGQPHKEVTVADGETTTVDFAIPPRAGKPVSGMVVDADGKPLADALVTAQSPTMGGSWVRTSKTDPGAFRFEAVGPNSLLRARVNGTNGNATPITVQGGETSVRLQITPSKWNVIGTVVDSAGKSIPYPRISVMVWYGTSGRADGQPLVGTIDGRFELKRLQTDVEYILDVEADGYGEINNLKIAPGAATIPPIHLVKATGKVVGRVLDTDQHPVAGMPVGLDTGKFMHVVHTDEQGRFTFPAASSGMYEWKVIVRHDRGSEFFGYGSQGSQKLFDVKYAQIDGDPLNFVVPKLEK